MGSNIRILFCFLFVFSGCSGHGVTTGHRINRFLRTSNWRLGDTVVVDIGSVIKRPFDYYYYSGGIAYRSTISDLLGFEYNGHYNYIGDDHWAVFFIKDNQVVYEEKFTTRYIDNFSNIEWAEAVSSPRVLFLKLYSDHRNSMYFVWFNARGRPSWRSWFNENGLLDDFKKNR